VLAGLLLAGTFFFFIGSVTRTTVATFVLMSVSPLLAALAGWLCCASGCLRALDRDGVRVRRHRRHVRQCGRCGPGSKAT
jgi:hypothetical protein